MRQMALGCLNHHDTVGHMPALRVGLAMAAAIPNEPASVRIAAGRLDLQHPCRSSEEQNLRDLVRGFSLTGDRNDG